MKKSPGWLGSERTRAAPSWGLTSFDPSHPRTARLQRVRGLTLVELLVVIVILSLVTVATIPLMQPPSGERKVREAARNVATTFELARARATETGRPAGVWIEPQTPVNGAVEAYKLYLCDVPPPYAGDDTSSVARITTTNPASATTSNVKLSGASALASLCKYGDRIRFNYRGPYYKIVGSSGSDGNPLTGTTFSIAVNSYPDYSPPPADYPDAGPGVPFEILRQPVKSSINPTILPTNAPASIVDLTQSGHGADNTEFGGNPNSKPVIVTFSPAGPVHQVIHYKADGSMELEQPASTLFFLVRLRKEQGFNGFDAAQGFKEFDAFWVSINPFTGLISVSASAGGANVTASRALAIQGRIEGGL